MNDPRVIGFVLVAASTIQGCGASTADPSTEGTGSRSGARGPIAAGAGDGGSSASPDPAASGRSSGDDGTSGPDGAAAGDAPDAASDASSAAPDAPASCTSSSVTSDQVIFIGDSFLAEPTSDIAIDLEALWQKAGSKAYSANPRYYQFVGTDMKQIAAQYDSAHSANPNIKIVVGNGGGNDVLVDDRSCLTQAPPANATCLKTITDTVTLADTLIGKMESDGVQHFVMAFYPHEPNSGIFQGTAPAINDSLDYAEPRVRAVCDKHPICTFVSFRAAMGEVPGDGYIDPNGYIKPNDVHPSTAGSQFFAGVMWDTMKAHCILTP